MVEADSDRILCFTAFGVGAGEIMSAVQMVMVAGLPYTAVRDSALAHPTLTEGLIPLFSVAPSAHDVVDAASSQHSA
jgi:pyruvate/2-oxoglutarate dehydrogenase complex dihydrolipoamide dehydrogenase (E3) component